MVDLHEEGDTYSHHAVYARRAPAATGNPVTLTSSASYTHVVCGNCSTLLYCSEADPWPGQGGTEYGWCSHSLGDDPCVEPIVSFLDWPSADSKHRCNGVMRSVSL